MADAPVAHIGENSPEEVAYKLLHIVAEAEGMTLHGTTARKANADRRWILDTYADCLLAVQHPAGRLGK